MTEAQFELLLAAMREQSKELHAIHDALRRLRYFLRCVHHSVHPRRAGRTSRAGLACSLLGVTAPICWREPHADIYTARSPTNRAGGENATTPAGSRPIERISWNPSARQGVLQVRYRAVRRKEKLLCQY